MSGAESQALPVSGAVVGIFVASVLSVAHERSAVSVVCVRHSYNDCVLFQTMTAYLCSTGQCAMVHSITKQAQAPELWQHTETGRGVGQNTS